MALARPPTLSITHCRQPRRLRWWLWPVLLRHHTTQTSAGIGEGATHRLPDLIVAECEDFIRRYEPQILNSLWGRRGEEDSAYALPQEVFLRAWQRFDVIRHYEQPRGWLFRVATNLALTHLRHRRTLVHDPRLMSAT